MCSRGWISSSRLGAAAVILGFGDITSGCRWVDDAIVLPVWLALPLATVVIWLSINATNCSDGVRRRVGEPCRVRPSLLLGGLLYAVIAHDWRATCTPADRRRRQLVDHGVHHGGARCSVPFGNNAPPARCDGLSSRDRLGLLLCCCLSLRANPFSCFCVLTRDPGQRRERDW